MVHRSRRPQPAEPSRSAGAALPEFLLARRPKRAAAAAIGLSLLAAGCGTSAAVGTTAGGLVVSVGGDDTFRFAPPEIRLASNQLVTVEFTNRGRIPHDFTTRGQTRNVSIVAQGGATGRGTFTAAAGPGRYEFVCAQPGHEAAGMKGILIIE